MCLTAGKQPAAGKWQLDKLRQKTLSKRLEEYAHENWLASKGTSDQAAIRSEMLPGASGFVTAIPSKVLGLAWEPEEFIVELQARLVMPVFGADGYCTACDAVMDTRGHHAKMCACLGDRVARHNATRNVVYRSSASAGFSPDLEKSDLLSPRPDDPEGRPNHRRPADVLLLPARRTAARPNTSRASNFGRARCLSTQSLAQAPFLRLDAWLLS